MHCGWQRPLRSSRRSWRWFRSQGRQWRRPRGNVPQDGRSSRARARASGVSPRPVPRRGRRRPVSRRSTTSSSVVVPAAGAATRHSLGTAGGAAPSPPARRRSPPPRSPSRWEQAEAPAPTGTHRPSCRAAPRSCPPPAAPRTSVPGPVRVPARSAASPGRPTRTARQAARLAAPAAPVPATAHRRETASAVADLQPPVTAVAAERAGAATASARTGTRWRARVAPGS